MVNRYLSGMYPSLKPSIKSIITVYSFYRKIGNGIVKGINLAGLPMEAMVAKETRIHKPPIFIVGQSRSGTTLLYQLFVSHFESSYFSNLFCKFYRIPSVCALITRPIGGCNPKPGTKNKYGLTKGWNNPNTGYPIWNRWFRRSDGKMDVCCTSRRIFCDMKRTVAAISNIYNAPFVNKWTPNSVRMLELNDAFPKALFIHMRRKNANVAQSILLARRSNTGNPFDSFVTWPEGFESKNRRDWIKNICEHIKLVEKEIERCRNIIGKDRFVDIDYEELCEAPMNGLLGIQHAYKRVSGLTLELRNVGQIPEKLLASKEVRIDKEDFRKFQAEFSSGI